MARNWVVELFLPLFFIVSGSTLCRDAADAVRATNGGGEGGGGRRCMDVTDRGNPSRVTGTILSFFRHFSIAAHPPFLPSLSRK